MLEVLNHPNIMMFVFLLQRTNYTWLNCDTPPIWNKVVLGGWLFWMSRNVCWHSADGEQKNRQWGVGDSNMSPVLFTWKQKKGGLLWKHLFLHAKPGFHGVMANKATSFGNFYRYVLFAHHFQDTLHPSEKFVVPTLAISINKHFSKKRDPSNNPHEWCCRCDDICFTLFYFSKLARKLLDKHVLKVNLFSHHARLGSAVILTTSTPKRTVDMSPFACQIPRWCNWWAMDFKNRFTRLYPGIENMYGFNEWFDFPGNKILELIHYASLSWI